MRQLATLQNNWHDTTDGLWALVSGGLLGAIFGFIRAVVVTAGPWLIAVAAIFATATSLHQIVGPDAVLDLTLSIVYAFFLAALVAGPIGMVAARITQSSLERDDHRDIFGALLITSLAAGVAAQLCSITFGLVLQITPIGLSIAFVFLTTTAALLWVCFAVLGALRSQGALVGIFAAGMTIGVLLALLSARIYPSTEMLIWAFSAGLTVSVGLALAYVNHFFGHLGTDLRASTDLVIGRLWPSRHIVLFVLLATLSIWVDKWFFWLAPTGTTTQAGFLYFEPYDTAAFFAQLTIIPTIASAFLFEHTDRAKSVDHFRHAIDGNATLGGVQAKAAGLRRTMIGGLTRIAFIQLTISLCALIMAPTTSVLLDFSAQQIALLQVGIMTVFLQSVVFLSCTVFILCGQLRVLVAIYSLFLITNVIGSFVFYALFGVTANAALLSAILCSIASVFAALRSLSDYSYITFLGENDSLYDQP